MAEITVDVDAGIIVVLIIDVIMLILVQKKKEDAFVKVFGRAVDALHVVEEMKTDAMICGIAS